MDIAHHVKAIQCPALGIGGTLDVFRSPEYVRSIMGPIPGVEFVTIETSHHQTVGTPEEIAEASVYWLSDESQPISGSVLELEQYPIIGRNPTKRGDD